MTTASGELLEKARHHRQKIIHPRAYASAYNRHVSMVRDAHWQSNDPNFHRFSSWLLPRQLFAAIVVTLLLIDALVVEQQSSRRVGAVYSWVIALAIPVARISQASRSQASHSQASRSQASRSQASLPQPKPPQIGTKRTSDTSTSDTSIAPVARADAPSTSSQNTTSTSPKITNFESNTKKPAYMTTSAAGSAGVLMFVMAVACPCM